jgi:serine/threonine protein kinase
MLGRFAERCLSARLLWWTPTAKAIASAEIVFGMKFLHSFGLIHGCLKPNNVLSNESYRIQFTDCRRTRFDPRESAAIECGIASEFAAPEPRSSEESTAKIDVLSFALILFEIVIRLPVVGRTSASEELGKLPMNTCERFEIPGFVPKFVSV